MSPAALLSDRRQLILLAGVVALGAGIYLQAAAGPVLWAERPALDALARLDPGAALAFQPTPDQARPLANLARYLLLLGTGSPASLRVAAALLHGANAVLICLLAAAALRRADASAGRTSLAPAAAGLVFAAHPLASEAVLSHLSLDVVLGTSLSLGCLLLSLSKRSPGLQGGFIPAGLYLAALLCYAGLWPVALVAAALAAWRKAPGGATVPVGAWLREVVPFGVSLGLFYVFWAARSWPALSFGPLSRPWPVVQGLASQAAAFVDVLRLIFLPVGLSVDQGRLAHVGDWNLQALGGAVLIAGLLGAALWAVRRPGLVGVAVAWAGFLQLHLLLAPPENPLAESRLYPLVAAVALLAGRAVQAIEARAGSRLAAGAAAVACIPLALISAGRARLWTDPAALWEAATRANPESARGYVALGNHYIESGETERALQAFEGALARAPRSAAIQSSIAEVYFARGDYFQALQEANKAMELDPRYLPAYITAGNSFLMRGQTRDAFLAFNAALLVDPDDPSALYNMGALHYREKQYVKAARLLDQANAVRPGDPETLFRLGLSRFYQGDYRGAKEALQGCLDLAPRRIDARVNLAASMTKLGEHEAAGALLQGILDEEPGNAEALNGMAILASTRDDRNAAQSYFERAVAADPENLQFLYNLAGIYEQTGQIEKAVSAYRQFVDRWRGSLDLGESVRERLEVLEARMEAERRAS